MMPLHGLIVKGNKTQPVHLPGINVHPDIQLGKNDIHLGKRETEPVEKVVEKNDKYYIGSDNRRVYIGETDQSSPRVGQ